MYHRPAILLLLLQLLSACVARDVIGLSQLDLPPTSEWVSFVDKGLHGDHPNIAQIPNIGSAKACGHEAFYNNGWIAEWEIDTGICSIKASVSSVHASIYIPGSVPFAKGYSFINNTFKTTISEIFMHDGLNEMKWATPCHVVVKDQEAGAPMHYCKKFLEHNGSILMLRVNRVTPKLTPHPVHDTITHDPPSPSDVHVRGRLPAPSTGLVHTDETFGDASVPYGLLDSFRKRNRERVVDDFQTRLVDRVNSLGYGRSGSNLDPDFSGGVYVGPGGYLTEELASKTQCAPVRDMALKLTYSSSKGGMKLVLLHEKKSDDCQGVATNAYPVTFDVSPGENNVVILPFSLFHSANLDLVFAFSLFYGPISVHRVELIMDDRKVSKIVDELNKDSVNIASVGAKPGIYVENKPSVYVNKKPKVNGVETWVSDHHGDHHGTINDFHESVKDHASVGDQHDILIDYFNEHNEIRNDHVKEHHEIPNDSSDMHHELSNDRENERHRDFNDHTSVHNHHTSGVDPHHVKTPPSSKLIDDFKSPRYSQFNVLGYWRGGFNSDMQKSHVSIRAGGYWAQVVTSETQCENLQGKAIKITYSATTSGRRTIQFHQKAANCQGLRAGTFPFQFHVMKGKSRKVTVKLSSFINANPCKAFAFVVYGPLVVHRLDLVDDAVGPGLSLSDDNGGNEGGIGSIVYSGAWKFLVDDFETSLKIHHNSLGFWRDTHGISGRSGAWDIARDGFLTQVIASNTQCADIRTMAIKVTYSARRSGKRTIHLQQKADDCLGGLVAAFPLQFRVKRGIRRSVKIPVSKFPNACPEKAFGFALHGPLTVHRFQLVPDAM